MSLVNEVIKKVEKDLKAYPDWLIKLECDGFGRVGGKAYIGGTGTSNFSSSVEKQVEIQMEVERKVYAIEKVANRLRGKTKDIIEQRYFEDYKREEILANTQLSKKQYYNLRNRAFEFFARALGYIE
ncbi:nitroreductase (plasmid) [Clostridium tagluense]|nr:nitroreductase [Clostridium tagluense]WLC68075.1 nitroreductase [Clostridium tagluense]